MSVQRKTTPVRIDVKAVKIETGIDIQSVKLDSGTLDGICDLVDVAESERNSLALTCSNRPKTTHS